MASESSKVFDFASDDILCSYQDYPNQQQSNGEAAIANNSLQDFNKNRMERKSVFPTSSYTTTDDSDHQEVIFMTVERSMKKHTDDVMRFLEGLSSRLSQLELYCYNLDKSIGEMRSDLTRDHGESGSKLKFLENHLQEVHRSVQILRDKQELKDTQKELAKLQLARKGSSSSRNSDRSSTPDIQKKGALVESRGQELALVPARDPEPVTQPSAYYLPPAGPTAAQYQWTPQVQLQPGSRLSSPQVYPQYVPAKPPVNYPESLPNSLPIQTTYSPIPPPGSNQPATNYSYGAPVQTTQPQRPPPPQQPQHMKLGYGGPPNGYMVYDNASGRVQRPSQGSQFYPPNQQQNSGGSTMMARPTQQFTHSRHHHHRYNELVDKLMSMGYRGDHVTSVIQRLDETGQTVDFNAVLDKLNGHSAYRGWSG